MGSHGFSWVLSGFSWVLSGYSDCAFLGSQEVLRQAPPLWAECERGRAKRQSETDRARQTERDRQSETDRARQAEPDNQRETPAIERLRARERKAEREREREERRSSYVYRQRLIVAEAGARQMRAKGRRGFIWHVIPE